MQGRGARPTLHASTEAAAEIPVQEAVAPAAPEVSPVMDIPVEDAEMSAFADLSQEPAVQSGDAIELIEEVPAAPSVEPVAVQDPIVSEEVIETVEPEVAAEEVKPEPARRPESPRKAGAGIRRNEHVSPRNKPEVIPEPILEEPVAAEEIEIIDEPVIEDLQVSDEPIVIDEISETSASDLEIEEIIVEDEPVAVDESPLLMTEAPVMAPSQEVSEPEKEKVEEKPVSSPVKEVEPSPEPVSVKAAEPAPAAVDDAMDAVDDNPAEKAPAFQLLPIPPSLRQEASLRDNAAYRRESRSLFRAQNWTDLVQMMQNVLMYAPWADLPEVRSSILKELAGIYGEKLNDLAKEKATYEQLLREDPANENALSYMETAFRANGDFKSIHDMYRRVVDTIWGGEERLFYTQKAVEIAEHELNNPVLAIEDWEHLLKLGENGEEIQSSLMTAYREHECWESLAQFISDKSADWGHVQRLGLREVIEIYISGLSDAQRASETLKVLLKSRPKDPLLLLQEINVCRINGDIDRLAELSKIPGLDKSAELDIHRAAAEVLWDKGERELAIQAYEAILKDLPDDRDALHAKEMYFSEGDHNEELCNFYQERATKALSENKQSDAKDFLKKAADVAETRLFDNERAIILLKQIIEQDQNDTDVHRKIISLYEAIDDEAGIASSMEALLALTSRPAIRRELLSKLGTFYLNRLENYERAEDCWKQVQAIDPRNPAVSEELSRVYAKKGDFESLDNSLTQQMRIADAENLLTLSESKGRYLMQHSPESAHTAAAWEMVLDCDPMNRQALEELGSVLEKLHRGQEMIGAWEQELKTIEDKDERISLALRIADAMTEIASHAQAVAAYLRVLNWNPVQESAISALESLCNADEKGIVIAILEKAATMTQDLSRRCELLRQTLRFIPKESVMQRIHVMRRLIVLGDRNIEAEMVELCRAEHQSSELCAAWLRRAYEAADETERDRLLSEVARFNAEDLSNPGLSFTLLFSAALDSEKAKVLAEELEKLAPQTNRWEEIVAVLGCLTTPQFSTEERKAAIEKRIDILLNKLDDPKRALEDYARLLSMDPANEDLLKNIEQLAHEKGLQTHLLGIYGELWDATDDIAKRAILSEKRWHILKDNLHLDKDALSELFVGYRLEASKDVENRLLEVTTDAQMAMICIPLLESEKRASSMEGTDGLKLVADIYENRLESIDDAFALYSTAMTSTPDDEASLNKLTLWSGKENLSGRYAQTLRLAAAKAKVEEKSDLSLSLYRKLSEFYRNTLNDLERSVDVERAILHIKPDCIESIDALISWHEKREEWPQLRSELKQRISAGASNEDLISLWFRVIALSNDQLNDLEGAFEGYAEILQLDENNEEARKGLEKLTGADMGPEVELRRLKLELKLATLDERPEIMLQLANLLDKQLSQPDAACEMLETLYNETGSCAQGYAPLVAMYKRQKSWSQLVHIILEHADALLENGDFEAATVSLNEALEIADDKIQDPALSVTIVEKLQKLEPDNDEIVERYCSGLRNAGDWSKYAETIKVLAYDANGRTINKGHLFELARIQALALNDIDTAINTYKAINKGNSVEKNAILGIATLALKKDDIDLYMSSMEQVVKLVDPIWGAIIYCHLAEVCDEKGKSAQVANYYRDARMLDANNVEASDSLRSIGRRLKNWRSTSALLPIPEERDLSWSERSKRLVEFAGKAESTDAARTWLWKAIVVNHDNKEAWQELAKLENKCGKLKECYEACIGACSAMERTTLPSADLALENAKFIYEAAQAASACGNDAKSEALIRKAFAIAPNFAPVAMAIGDLEQDADNLEKAYSIYDNILKNPKSNLTDSTRSEVLFKRGLISNIRKNYGQALDDLRETVKLSPLHYDALMAIAKTYSEMHQPLLALSCLQKSLLVTPDHTKRRGNTYYDMGKLWSDVFKDTDEAGIYYEGALNNGASNVDLVERSLEVYKRAGRCEEALELVDTLTKTTTNPSILASLWCTRGELSESISTENATEAYDMALSYQPGMARAFDGLERMLVVRQEWEQLAALLDGRLEGDLPKDQEAAILLRLADLYANQLNAPSKASQILYRILENTPSAEVIERLLAMPQDDESKMTELLEKAIVYCNGSYNYALKLAQQHLQAGRELQTWAIMSPLRALLQLDAQTKETLNDLKNKFEKVDSISPDTLEKALPVLSDEQFAMLDAIQLVSAKIGTLGARNINEVTSGASEVSETTPNGKIFQQMRVGLGLENISLWRSAELPEAIVIINSDPVVVCIRTEIFQKAAGNELQFWLAKALGLAHPDVRIIASTPEKYRAAYPKAILAAVGICDVTAETQELVEKIKTGMTEEDLKGLKAQLSIYPSEQLVSCAEVISRDMMDSSDMLGAYIVADMRTVWRAESRIDLNITEQRNVKTIDEISKAIEISPILRKILAYYVSAKFTEHIG